MSLIPVDDRAVSEVLGAILVFALVLTLLVIVQAVAVPAANGQIEFEHSQRVQGDVADLSTSVDEVARTGSSGAVAVETGVRYPSRFFLLNPAPASGSLETRSSAVELSNVRAENDETADYLNGDDLPFDSRVLVYRPDYNHHQSAPTTVYEHGIVYNQHPEGTDTVRGAATLVDGRRITLTTLDGQLSTASADPTLLQLRPVSAPAERVSVRGASESEPVTIELESELSEARWRTLLVEELDPDGSDPGKYVSDIECSSSDPEEPCGTLTITMEPGNTYELALAKVGVGDQFTREQAHYLTTSDTQPSTVSPGGSRVTAVVRDRFNNPVSGVEVTFSSSNGEFPGGNTVTTDKNGVAAARFLPGPVGEQATITATIPGGESRHVVDYTVDIAGRAGQTDVGGVINPNDPTGGVVLSNVEQLNGSTFRLTLTNTASEDREISHGRLNFYYNARAGVSSGPARGVVNPTATSLTIRGRYQPIGDGISIDAGTEQSVTVQFYNRDGTLYTQANADDFFVLSAIIDGESAVYFVAPGSGGIDELTVSGGTASGPTGNDKSGVQFDVQNNLGESATITGVRVESVDGASPTELAESRSGTGSWRNEVYVSTTDSGHAEAGDAGESYSIGTMMPLTESASLTAGENGEVYLYQFRDSAGAVDMSGTTVTVTIRYEIDGTPYTQTKELTVSGA